MNFYTALTLAASTAVLAACATQPIPTAPPVVAQTAAAPAKAASDLPTSMLWVGNSFFYYNNSMHSHVGALLNASGVKGVRQTSVTISGSGINWHDMSAHFKPGGVGSYSFMPDNSIKFNSFEKPFDIAMMMDCSQCPIHPQLKPVFFDTVKKHAATVRANRGEPVLFMSWAYQDAPAMTEQLAAEYVKAGKDNNLRVVPAGYAFANSMKAKPDINLYVADKRHPSLAGTYLASCVVMASLFKQNPVGNSYTAGLPADVALHLQTVARDTVAQFKQ